MFNLESTSLNATVRVIQSSLSPIFLLTAVSGLLSVFATRLARISDQVHTLAEIDSDNEAEDDFIKRRLAS